MSAPKGPLGVLRDYLPFVILIIYFKIKKAGGAAPLLNSLGGIWRKKRGRLALKKRKKNKRDTKGAKQNCFAQGKAKVSEGDGL